MTGTTDRDYLKSHVDLPEGWGSTFPQPKAETPVLAPLYLVVLNTSLDDFVLRSFADYDEAVAYIKAEPPTHAMPDIKNAHEVYGRDQAEINGYNLITVENGVPVACIGFYFSDVICDDDAESVNHWPGKWDADGYLNPDVIGRGYFP